ATILRRAATAAIVAGVMAAQISQAGAVSLSVQYACMGDYFRYCSAHDADSPGVRRCMSANGHRLTQTCVNALVKAGEVSQAEVNRRAARAKSARAR
ncbi:MAG: hypothetical protein AB7G35_17190, partial [Hyphomicrobiaceae bacterium]